MKSEYSRIPLIPYSEAAACAPSLVTFGDFGRPAPEYGEQSPRLPDDCSNEGPFRLARLPASQGQPVYLHIYNGSAGRMQFGVYGVTAQGKTRPLTKCIGISAVAYRMVIPAPAPEFTDYLFRFTLSGSRKEWQEEDFVALSAYAGREPGPAKGETQRQLPPMSCDGKSFQRLILSSCDRTDDLKGWAVETGLPIAESYHGEAGSVVALGVPQGIDLNTTGGSAQRVRAKVNAGEGTVERDYIINLFHPTQPTDTSGKTRRAEAEQGIGDKTEKDDRHDCDERLSPVTVAIIDSGVDDAPVNRHRWEGSRYRQGPATAFIQPGRLGYDFMNHDADPEDQTPHGTYVAAALLAQYRAANPLQLLHLKTFGPNGLSTYFGALVSIFEAVAAGVQVIHMSWGITQPERPPALECAIRTAAKHGVFVVTSAGNDGRDLHDQPQWPAAFAPDYPDHLLTVASYWYGEGADGADPDRLELTDWSNYGDEEVPLAAFLTTGVPEFGTGQLIYPAGTSISAPIVSGLLADWLARHPGGALADFRRTYFDHAPRIADQITDGAYLPLKHTQVPV